MVKIFAGAILKHYKGKDYLVVGKCIHTETFEKLVVYRSLYPASEEDKKKGISDYQLWTRPEQMFYEKVNDKPRFTNI